MKSKEYLKTLRNKTKQELKAEVVEQRRQLIKIQFDLGLKKQKDLRGKRKLRRQTARALTILGQTKK